MESPTLVEDWFRYLKTLDMYLWVQGSALLSLRHRT